MSYGPRNRIGIFVGIKNSRHHCPTAIEPSLTAKGASRPAARLHTNAHDARETREQTPNTIQRRPNTIHQNLKKRWKIKLKMYSAKGPGSNLYLIRFAATSHEVAAGAEADEILLVRVPAVGAHCALLCCVYQAQRAVRGCRDQLPAIQIADV